MKTSHSPSWSNGGFIPSRSGTTFWSEAIPFWRVSPGHKEERVPCAWTDCSALKRPLWSCAIWTLVHMMQTFCWFVGFYLHMKNICSWFKNIKMSTKITRKRYYPESSLISHSNQFQFGGLVLLGICFCFLNKMVILLFFYFSDVGKPMD